METFLVVIVGLILTGLALAMSFLSTCGILWLICWAFGFTFSWKVAFGIWLVMILLKSIFKTTVKEEK